MRLFAGIVLTLALAILPLSADSASAASTNNFRISSFDIQYDLSKDESGRSVLKTNETITAEFPSANQNHGLERAIPSRYDKHSTSLSINSITNGQGDNLEWSVDNDNDISLLRIGNADTYVHGTQTYRISYTQHDVTRFYSDNNRDEWYWDTNGTEWKVPIDQLSIAIRVDKNLEANRVAAPMCYEGVAGATNQCTLIPSTDGSYVLNARNLSAGENVTVAFGFQQGTFAAYQQSTGERIMMIWLIVFAITSGLAIALIIALGFAYYRKNNRTNELHTIVTEYIPPKGTSVMVSSQVLTTAVSIFSAQLIDLAVRHFIEIIETKEKSTWKAAEYDIKIITDPKKLLSEEREMLSDMFGELPKVGDRLALSTLRNNTKYYMRTTDNDKKLKALIEGDYAIREKVPAVSRYFYKWSIAMLVIGLPTLSPLMLIFAGAVALQGAAIRPLTDKGLELRRYLLGLDKYIKAAEVERLKFLQGPDTAQKIGESVDVNDAGQLVKLYERVLPYAILFGREKEWGKRLGEFYENTQTSPDWYNGSTAFNAVVFATALNSFSTAASYSGGSSSTSSGSSGGGSSGGGGGGGGGGGW